jgi:hypothetical protein
VPPRSPRIGVTPKTGARLQLLAGTERDAGSQTRNGAGNSSTDSRGIEGEGEGGGVGDGDGGRQGAGRPPQRTIDTPQWSAK